MLKPHFFHRTTISKTNLSKTSFLPLAISSFYYFQYILDPSILLHHLYTWLGISSLSLRCTSFLSSRTSAIPIPLISYPLPLSIAASLNSPFLTPFSSISIPRLSVFLSALLLNHTYFMPMTLNFSSPTFLRTQSAIISDLQSTIF